MPGLIAGVVAAFVGILVGFWLRHSLAKWEKERLERRVQEQASELIAVRGELAQAQGESAGRAGFASLAGERAKTIAQLTTEKDGLREELRAKVESESRLTARVSELETELRNERQNLAEKLALLDSAKQALANQFEALAAYILEK
jgi:DNA recombination protein RmuC